MSMTNVKPVTPLKPHTRDLGGFQVSRVLPGHPLQMVGPFIFFDHMGPAVFAPGQGVDVRPHPHIGLATVTDLFEGAIMHRDSLGSGITDRAGRRELDDRGRWHCAFRAHPGRRTHKWSTRARHTVLGRAAKKSMST